MKQGCDHLAEIPGFVKSFGVTVRFRAERRGMVQNSRWTERWGEKTELDRRKKSRYQVMKSVHQNTSSQNGHLKPRLDSSRELVRRRGWWKRNQRPFQGDGYPGPEGWWLHWISTAVVKGSQFKNKDYELSFRLVESEARARCSSRSSKFKTDAQI